jgi:hypothetical protein
VVKEKISEEFDEMIDLNLLEYMSVKAAAFTDKVRAGTKDVGNQYDWDLYVHLIQFL